MKETKTDFRFFSILNYEKEENYLRKRQKQGWELTKIRLPGFYTFKKSVPADVIYQMDYGQKNCDTEKEYKQMMADFGWDFILEYAGFSYFKKPAQNKSVTGEHFFDMHARYDLIKRIFWGKCIPVFIAFLFSVLLPLYSAIQQQSFSYFFIALLVFFALYVAFFLRYAYCYLKLRKQCKP